MEESDPLDCYEAIGSTLASGVECSWEQIDVEATLGESSVQLIMTYTTNGGEVKDLNYVPLLGTYFFDLSRIVSTKEKGFYKKCNFVLTKSGKFVVSFEY